MVRPRVPAFSIAALWNVTAAPDPVSDSIVRMASWPDAGRAPEILVALLEREASVEVRVELNHYPRAVMAALAAQVERSGGAFVELWRLPKGERDAFRASVLGGAGARPHPDAARAAQAVRHHLGALARPARPEQGDSRGAATIARLRLIQARPGEGPAGSPRGGAELRQARRHDVTLEVEFRTAAEFTREYALNISRGGLFVRTQLRPDLDSVAFVTVRLPSGESIQGEALVVHHREGEAEGGIGLAFLSEDRAFAERLDRYLAQLGGE